MPHKAAAASAASCAVDSARVRSPQAHHFHPTRVAGQLVNMALEKVKSLLKELEASIKELESSQQSRAIDDVPYRVIHLNQNPFDKNLTSQRDAFEALKEENKWLRARLELLELGVNADITRKIDDAVDQVSEIESLSRKAAELKTREEKIITSFDICKQRFVDVCYRATGYKIEPLHENIYRLSHAYAEGELFFKIENGIVELLGNEFTDHYSEFVRTYLEGADSFPSFLAAITLDLFRRKSMVDMSMTIMVDN